MFAADGAQAFPGRVARNASVAVEVQGGANGTLHHHGAHFHLMSALRSGPKEQIEG